MSISTHMKRLGAPLANIRTSWGSIRESDGTVFLVVWNGETQNEGKGILSQLIGKKGKVTPERQRHIDMLKDGAVGFFVMRSGTNMENTGGFNARILWRIGQVYVDKEGDTRALIDGTVDSFPRGYS
jgi:hypothetical protein